MNMMSNVAGIGQPKADRAAYVKDPLLKKATLKLRTGNLKVSSITDGRKTYHMTMISGISFLSYVTILFLMIELFATNQWLCITLVVTLLILSALVGPFMMVFFPSSEWRAHVGRVSTIMMLVGIVVGTLLHYKYMVFYEHWKSMKHYTNVAGAENPVQFADAGRIQFSADTEVDLRRSVGYRNWKTSTTMCIAPVVDATMESTAPVGFFAVGVGCCGWRGSFNCDDIADPKAKSGLLLMEPKMLVSDTMKWTVDGAVDFEGYDAAIKLASSVFGMPVAKQVRLLRWVKDPMATAQIYRSHALMWALASCVIVFIVCVAMATMLIYPRNAKAGKQTLMV